MVDTGDGKTCKLFCQSGLARRGMYTCSACRNGTEPVGTGTAAGTAFKAGAVSCAPCAKGQAGSGGRCDVCARALKSGEVVLPTQVRARSAAAAVAFRGCRRCLRTGVAAAVAAAVPAQQCALPTRPAPAPPRALARRRADHRLLLPRPPSQCAPPKACPGYTSDDNRTACIDIDECTANGGRGSCVNGATCTQVTTTAAAAAAALCRPCCRRPRPCGAEIVQLFVEDRLLQGAERGGDAALRQTRAASSRARQSRRAPPARAASGA